MKKTTITRFYIFAAAILLAAFTPSVSAQTPPGLMNFQGRLTDTANNPLSGPHDFTFAIFDAITGGNQLWTETQNGVTVANGVLAAQLGAVAPLSGGIFGSSAAYLEITVDGTALSPRQRLITSPYAFNSSSLEGRGYAAFVSTDASAQTIAGDKTFTGSLIVSGGNMVVPQLRLAADVTISSETSAALGAGVRVSTNMYVVGFASATKYYGDGSALTGITGVADHLGNHTAAMALNMSGFDINYINHIVASSGSFGYSVTASSYTATGALGLGAARIRLAENVFISSETSAILGGGVSISSHVYILGIASATKFYGDGSGLTGVGTEIPQQHIVKVIPGANVIEGAVYTTIADALAYVAAQSPAADNRWAVQLGAGSYPENFSVPDWVLIAGADKAATILTGQVQSSSAYVGTLPYRNVISKCTIANLYLESGHGLMITDSIISGGSDASGTGGGFVASDSTITGGTWDDIALVVLSHSFMWGGNISTSYVGLYINSFIAPLVSNIVLGGQIGIGNSFLWAVDGARTFTFTDENMAELQNCNYFDNPTFNTPNRTYNFYNTMLRDAVYTAGTFNHYGTAQSAKNVFTDADISGTLAFTDSNRTIAAETDPAYGAGIKLSTSAHITDDLYVAGQIKIMGGSPAANRVLTSDANGLAQWMAPASSGGDSLGTHVATTTLQMGAYGVNTSSDITAGKYQINGHTVLEVLPGEGSLAVGGNAGSVNTGIFNIFVGSGTGKANTTGSVNTFVGGIAGAANISGEYNSFFGGAAGGLNTIGSYNSFIGGAAGAYNTTGQSNVFVGVQTGNYNTTGGNNTFLGANAGFNTQNGSANVLLGMSAGYGEETYSFSSSTIMGYNAGFKLRTGNDNVLIGFQAGDALTTGSGNIVIGYDQDASAAAAANELNIGGVLFGDLSAKTIGISTRVPYAALDIVSTGTSVNEMAQIWRNTADGIVSSMSATGVLMASKFVGDGSGLTGILGGASIDISTINAEASTPFGGVNITTNAFIQGNVGIGTTSPDAALHVVGVSSFTDKVYIPENGLYVSSGAVGQVLKKNAGGWLEWGYVGVPTGTITFFDLPACPNGWTEVTSAQGRYMVGLPSGGTLAGTVGTALTDLENRAVGQHNHSITDPGHVHNILGDASGGDVVVGGDSGSATKNGIYSGIVANNTTGITVDNAGSVAGTNAPYIQYKVCKCIDSAACSSASGGSGSIGLAVNLAGGAAGAVAYQSSENNTTFLNIGVNNTVLTSNGSVPAWSNAPALSGANFTGVVDGALSANVALLTGPQSFSGAKTFNAETAFPGSGVWNASGNVGIGTTGPTTSLDVAGNAQFGSGILKSTFTAVPGGSDYALYLSSGLYLSAGGIRWPDNTISTTAASVAGGLATINRVQVSGWGTATCPAGYVVSGCWSYAASGEIVSGVTSGADTCTAGGGGSYLADATCIQISGTQTGGWSLNGLKTYYNAGNVGIGTVEPAASFDVSGNAQFGSGILKSTFTAVPGGSDYALYLSSGLYLSAGGIRWPDNTVSTTAAGGGSGGGDVYLASTQTFTGANIFVSTAAFTAQHASVPGVTISSGLVVAGGNVGIGTVSPSAALHVQDYTAGQYTMQVSTSSTAGQYSIAVSSTGVTNINNLVIENRTSDPVAPITGQIWFIVD